MKIDGYVFNPKDIVAEDANGYTANHATQIVSDFSAPITEDNIYDVTFAKKETVPTSPSDTEHFGNDKPATPDTSDDNWVG